MEDAHSGTVTGRFEGSKGIVCRYPQGGKKLAGALVEKSGGGEQCKTLGCIPGLTRWLMSATGVMVSQLVYSRCVRS